MLTLKIKKHKTGVDPYDSEDFKNTTLKRN